MELVYLWVEKYKNIYHQGFNFSPRFECNYDGENLTITSKEHLENFFGKNINITAIVGENGSGKSSLISEIINKIIFNTKIEYKQPASLICFLNDDKNKIYISSHLIENDSNVISNFDFRLTHYREDIFPNNLDKEYEDTAYTRMKISKDFRKEYYRSFFYMYNNSLEIDSYYHKTYEYNPELLFFSEVNKSDNIINLEKEEEKTYGYLMTLLLNQNRVPKEIKNFFLPTKLFLDREILINYFDGLENEIDEEEKYKKLRKHLSIKDVLKLETILYLHYFSKKNSHNREYDDIIGHIRMFYRGFKDVEAYDEIYKFLESNLTEYLNKIDFTKQEIRRDDNRSNDIKELNELEKTLLLLRDLDELVPLVKNINNDDVDLDYEIDVNLLNNEKQLFLKRMPSYLKIDFANKTGRRFNELSSGEQNLLKLMFSIENIIQLRQGKTDSLYILLDEIETAFHPNWQKRILNWLIEFVKHYEMQINIIVASHSPFILSDLPKENVIFLEKYEDKDDEVKNGNQKISNCKNVTKETNLDTFGANIHSLLSHGFFMKDGLMGEFAKSKINDAYDFLSNANTQTNLTQIKAQEIINLMGEPILKKELQYLYDVKFETSEIERQIREHQEAIERLQAQRSRND